MKHNIESTVRMYANKFLRETDAKERDSICREVGNYLSLVSSGEEFNFYAMEYITLIHPQSPVVPDRHEDAT